MTLDLECPTLWDRQVGCLLERLETMNGVGPRRVGGRYFNGYWQQGYEVVAIGAEIPWADWSITVLWDDGRTTTHCTAWEPKRDRVLVQA